MPVPDDANIGTFADQLMVTLRSEWLGYAAGSLLVAPCADFMAAEDDAARKALMKPLFEPTETSSLSGSSDTKNYCILSVLDDVVTELRFWRYDGAAWSLERAFREDGFAQIGASSVDGDESDRIWVTTDGCADILLSAVRGAILLALLQPCEGPKPLFVRSPRQSARP